MGADVAMAVTVLLGAIGASLGIGATRGVRPTTGRVAVSERGRSEMFVTGASTVGATLGAIAAGVGGVVAAIVAAALCGAGPTTLNVTEAMSAPSTTNPAATTAMTMAPPARRG